MAESLRYYDVDQNGWEGDPEGPGPATVEANLVHVSFHLTDVIERKDFNDTTVAKEEIAPDAAQYGLRIARWGGLPLDQVVPTEKQRVAYQTASNLGISTHNESYFALASFVRASGVLARQLHGEDHRRSKEKAMDNRTESLADAAALYNTMCCRTVK